MRVLFDGYWWRQGPAANRSVQRDLVRAWARHFPDDELHLAVRRLDVDVPRGIADLHRTRLWPHMVSNVFELGRLGRRIRADVVVAHNYTPRHGRAATFIHDAMFVDHPEWFSIKERAYFAPMIPTSRRALLCATSTRTEATRLERLRQHGGRVFDIGLAVPTELATAAPQAPEPAPTPGHFGLTVGRLNVRKNLAAVVAGAAHSRIIGPDRPLLIVGSSEYSGVDADLPSGVGPLVDAGVVRFLGRVTDAELSWLYRNAAVSICLSLDEGFGLPPIEAVQFGCPVVASDIKVFRETVGEYARFVDPHAPPAAVAHALDAAWASLPDRHTQSTILERYTWAESVRRLRTALAEVL